MPESFPYIISNNKIEPILSRIRSAAKPTRFSRDTLATWGFTASNDRSMTGVLKELGFLSEGGAPTEHYDRLRDPNDWRFVLAERMRDLYADLFSIDGNIQSAPDVEVKGAISRVTGKDDESVKRYYSTFKTLASLARFDPKTGKSAAKADDAALESAPNPRVHNQDTHLKSLRGGASFHYNVQIHLPVTTDITVYNAIFRSLKEHLGVE